MDLNEAIHYYKDIQNMGAFYFPDDEIGQELIKIAIDALEQKRDNDEKHRQGILMELPCPEGTPVYRIGESGASTVHTIEHNGHKYRREIPMFCVGQVPFRISMLSEYNRRVFLTEFDAMKAMLALQDSYGDDM